MLHLPIKLCHRGECQKNRKSPIIDHPNARERGFGGCGLLIGTVQGQLGRRRHGGCLVQDLHLAIRQGELGLAENGKELGVTEGHRAQAGLERVRCDQGRDTMGAGCRAVDTTPRAPRWSGVSGLVWSPTHGRRLAKSRPCLLVSLAVGGLLRLDGLTAP